MYQILRSILCKAGCFVHRKINRSASLHRNEALLFIFLWRWGESNSRPSKYREMLLRRVVSVIFSGGVRIEPKQNHSRHIPRFKQYAWERILPISQKIPSRLPPANQRQGDVANVMRALRSSSHRCERKVIHTEVWRHCACKRFLGTFLYSLVLGVK